MEKLKNNFKLTDGLLILGMIAPIAVGALLKILFIPAAEGVEISGAHIFFTIPLPLGGLPITETQVNQWLVLISLFFLCRYLTADQAIAVGLLKKEGHKVSFGDFMRIGVPYTFTAVMTGYLYLWIFWS